MNTKLLHGLAVAALLPLLKSVPAQDVATGPIRGPFWSGTVMRAKGGGAAAMKGLAINLGPDKRSHVVYDLDTLRLSVAWMGDFLEFGNTLTKIEWPPPPSVKGTNIVFDTAMGPGWADASGNFSDPRDRQQGPLPKNWAHYEGLYRHGDQVVLKYTVGNVDILESPSLLKSGDQTVFIRTVQPLAALKKASIVVASVNPTLEPKISANSFSLQDPSKGTFLAVTVDGPVQGTFQMEKGQVVFTVTNAKAGDAFRLSAVTGSGTPTLPVLTGKPVDLRKLTKGGPAQWAETVTTQGKLDTGGGDGSYVVDTLTEPFPNPYRVSTFIGGFDFLPDGRAAVCTFHGDVWIVSGINASLEKLTWKRYATGMFQPLGLKVVKGDIYVAGRDQITRLKDLNGDGEADLYENFNNDTVVTPNYHEFVLDLHTDSKGNFYYAKGAPWEPGVTSPHQGTILKVSADGKKMEVFATGLRAPNGMTVGPDDTVLVGDNQGHWMPSSKLNLVRQGSFMGMVPSAQKEVTLKYSDGREIRLNPSDPAARKANGLKGWDGAMPIPTTYDQPIAWLPMRWDNSSGGQVYVTSDKWGPWKGSPLFMSYGKGLLYGVSMDTVDGTVQASMVPFGLKFQSGIMRGRFSEKDGQLYVAGLKGWQNAATRDGGIYRVRYTGKPVRQVLKAHAAKNGLQLSFSTALDPKIAVDPTGYSVEVWNYKYSGSYGSPELSVKTVGKNGHDKLEVKSAKLSADGKTVFLEIDGLTVADQFSVKYTVNAADGVEMRSEVIGTIHKLGAEITQLR